MGKLERLNPKHQEYIIGGQPQRLRDALGRVLEVGDEVLLVHPSQRLRVAEVRPMLEAGAPANTLIITLVCRVRIGAPRDSALDDVYLLRRQAEMGEGAMQEAEAQDKEIQEHLPEEPLPEEPHLPQRDQEEVPE